MSVPKRKKSKSKRNTRKAVWKQKVKFSWNSWLFFNDRPIPLIVTTGNGFRPSQMN